MVEACVLVTNISRIKNTDGDPKCKTLCEYRE